MKVKEISEGVIEWHEIDAVKGICHIAWDSGHCSKKSKKPTNTEHHQEEEGESIFPQTIKKTVVFTYQQYPRNQSFKKLSLILSMTS